MDTYEKKYKNALERARVWKEKSGMPADKQGILDDIFPELKESEDEKVRKEIVEYLKKNLRLEWATWLEKQGEVESDNDDIEVEEKGIREAFNKIEDEKQCKQKPQRMISAEAKEAMYAKTAWSEEDEAMWDEISNLLWEGYKHSGSKFSWDDIRNWVNPKLKSLRPQSTWKPSDEQIEILDMVLTNESMDDNITRILRELREQLKKLKGE